MANKIGRGKKKKVSSEQETRIAILRLAKKHNCMGDIQAIFSRYDNLLRNCTNATERNAISQMGIVELHNFFYCKGELIINGQEVIPASEEVDYVGKVVKLD